MSAFREAVAARKARQRTRLTDLWLALDVETVTSLGWDEDTMVDYEVAGDTLIVTRSEDQSTPERPAPSRKAKL